MNYKVISANRGPKRTPKNWRIHEKEMLEKHFGPVLDVNGEDGHSVLDAFNKYKDTVTHIRWYPDPEQITKEEYLGMIRQNELIGNLPFITNSAEGFINVQSKEYAFKKWKEKGINCPDFFVYKDKSDFYIQQEKHKMSFPFLIRVNNGVSGRSTYVVRSEKDLDPALSSLDKNFQTATPKINTTKLCVKLINSAKDNVNSSFRIHVAGNRVISGYARVVDGNEWLAITAGKFKPSHIDNFVRYNELCEKIMTHYEDEICRAVHVLNLNHQGVDIIIDNDTNELCFLEVQPTYASGYGPDYPYFQAQPYRPPYWNPYDPFLVQFLQQNESELSKVLPRYYYNWLDKQNHFDLVYKSIKEYLNVWT
jgi:glutathione synthase/RimK-type ligase-like ATP-grasp enzyme